MCYLASAKSTFDGAVAVLGTVINKAVDFSQLPVTQQPVSLKSDASLADKLQMEEVLEGSKRESRSSIAKQVWQRMNIFRKKVKIEFRVVVLDIPKQFRAGYAPAVKIAGKFINLKKHRLGYYFEHFGVHGDSLTYLYCLSGIDYYVDEYLPNDCEKRVISVDGNSITHDVACFNKVGLNYWKKVVHEKMKSYLPNARVVLSKDFELAQSDILHWIKSAKIGWELMEPQTVNHRLTKEDIEKILKDWLVAIEEASNNSQDHVEKRLLCSLHVAAALFQMKHSIGNPKFFKMVCNGLEMHKLEHQSQILLCRNIYRNYREWPGNVTQALDFLLQNIDPFQNPEWILIMPLYISVAHGGEIINRIIMPHPQQLYDRAMLPNIGDERKWITLRDGIIQEKKKRKDFLVLADAIVQASKVHEWIVDTYQYFLSADMVIYLINKDSELSKRFQLDSVFQQILPLLEQVADDSKTIKANRLKVVGLSTYLECRFATLSRQETIQMMTTEQKIYVAKNACSIGDRVKKTLTKVLKTTFSNGERNSLSWLVSMATKSASLFYSLDVTGLCDVNPDSFFTDIANMIKMRISDYGFTKLPLIKVEVEFYNNMFHKLWSGSSSQKKWIEMLEEGIKDVMDNKWIELGDGINFLRFYVENLRELKLHERLNFHFTEKADASAKDILMFYDSPSGLNLLKELRRKGGKRVESAFANSFMKEFRRVQLKSTEENFRMQALQFLLDAPIVLRFYRLFDPESIPHIFYKSDYKDARKVHEIACGLLRDFSQKHLTLEELELVLQYRTESIELMILTRSSDTTQHQAAQGLGKKDLELEMLFKTSAVELKNYKTDTEALEFFVNFCKALEEKDIQVECSSLMDFYGRKHSELKLSELKQGSLCQEEMAEIYLVYTLKGCHILKVKADEVAGNHFKKAQTDSENGGLLNMNCMSVLDTIWKDVKTELQNFVEGVDKEKQKPETLTEAFSFSNGEENLLRKELFILYKFTDAALKTQKEAKTLQRESAKKAQQIAMVFQIQRNRHTLKWFDDFQKANDLKGDFALLQEHQISCEGLDENRFQKLRGILEISPKELDILNEFTSQKLLIDWIKSKMKKESNVRDLSLIAKESTRYSPMQADRWLCLADAVAGYEALLFSLDRISNLNDLLARCKAVWRKAKQDGVFVEKWCEAGKDVAWYKNNEKWYGSEEKAALHLAEQINEQGQYVIAASKKDSDSASLENSIKLRLSRDVITPKDEGITADELLEIGIDYLRGIQSTLTLISSDSDEDSKLEIQQFLSVLNAMESLASSYVELVNAGFMLMNEWELVASCKKSVSCEVVTEYTMSLKITFKKELPPLVNTVSIRDLTLLSDILRDAWGRWNYHISRMRLKHYFLNDYSMQQIKYLCGQLGKVRQRTLEEQAYLLLSDWPKSGVTPIIHDSLNKAMAGIDLEDSTSDEGIPSNCADVSEEVMHLRKRRHAVRYLVNNESASETLAKAAVQAEGPEDFTICTNWMLIHEYDDDLVRDMCREFDKEAGFVCDRNDIQEDMSILQNRSARTLEGMIDILLSKEANMGSDLLQAVKTIFTGYLTNTTILTLRDSLSVNHLGKFLTILHSKMEEKVPTISRQLPKIFTKGKPNFIQTQKHYVIRLILSLYANSATSEQQQSSVPQLPTAESVLLCSENTTEDEVERFMHRALCQNQEKAKELYCLAFTENLDLNVSKAMESVFDKLSQDENCSKDYQLVMLSSDPQHFVSIRFDKNRVETPEFDVASTESYIKEYMTKKTCLGKEKAKVVSSTRSGVGKSLHVKRVMESLHNPSASKTVRLLEKNINMGRVVRTLLRGQDLYSPQLIHIDLTPAVENGIEKFMFDLLILGMIKDSTGIVWRNNKDHSYIIEVTSSSQTKLAETMKLLPFTKCQAPKLVLYQIKTGKSQGDTLMMDEGEYKSDVFQRPYQYLIRKKYNQDLSKFDFATAKEKGELQDNLVGCLEVLLDYCGIPDPSWAQLKHFVSFLNFQLVNCEKSPFCPAPELRGLKELAVKFMINMAQDFATPSLEISDESEADAVDRKQDVLASHQIRRKWEQKEHPYVFFNDDGQTMTFMNIDVDKAGNVLDKEGNKAIEGTISQRLLLGLRRQGMDIGKKFHEFSRQEMLIRLCRMMGIELAHNPTEKPHDPDPSYKLTTDNVLKMIAIYLRLRCNIPVIIMGETGCGKTRMIEFMSRLQAGPSKEGAIMKTLKVHGGIGVHSIFQSVEDALATATRRKVLFYDEANTTTAIYAIKEVMCDLTIDGQPFEDMKSGEGTSQSSHIHVVAACNPYKQLSKEALQNMKSSGLGYRVATSTTSERLGSIAMRTLVYKVVALPPSLQPFVWDFGKLSEETERIYIEKIVKCELKEFPLSAEISSAMVRILSRAQEYMKNQDEECRYVSLRDVERSVKLYKWFGRHKDILFKEMDKMLATARHNEKHPTLQESLRCLLHAIGISYYVSLENRQGFREEISAILQDLGLEVSQSDITKEYKACQTIFHRNLKSEDNIAWNEALRENVFLMAICTDMKLPLYIIGKPGSSKSLAKTIVESNMNGSSSNSPLFQRLRKVEVISFQCSALTKADGIRKIFSAAAERQKRHDIEKFTSLVVLDEIGLAEDSIHMPLKLLHPLLESGNADTGCLSQYKESEKVAFTGISNWALDPAKMNRGIFVTRGIPDQNDLIATAKSLFQGKMGKINEHYTLLENLTKAYLEVYKEQGDQYFGLRDYYSLIKMIRSMCENREMISKEDVAYVLKRNFSGGKERHQEVVLRSGSNHLDLQRKLMEKPCLKRLVSDNIKSADCRFLLLLTVQRSSMNLLQYIMPDFQEAQVIFGSSFPGDQTYTEICRSISRIKICMEKGRKAILLNMTNIHESLYDVLNQHFVTFADQRYVAIGLGSHRVWTRIHRNFGLIVIEKKSIALDAYPIPLLNRLEKHHLLSKNLLTADQEGSANALTKWSKNFGEVGNFNISSAFIGYHEDTSSSVVLAYSNENPETHKKILLQVATADSIYRLPNTKLQTDTEQIMKVYMEEQVHDCLFHLLETAKENRKEKIEIFEVFSFSNILTEEVRREIEFKLNLPRNSVMLLFLKQFKVDAEYIKKLEDFFLRCQEEPKTHGEGHENSAVLLIQTAQAHKCEQMIECAKHNFWNNLAKVEKRNIKTLKTIIVFISCTARCLQSNENTFELSVQHTQRFKVVYVDELRHLQSNSSTTLITSFYGKSIADIIQDGITLLENSKASQSHVMCLLQDCISVAMAKVTNSGVIGQRKLERIYILQQLFGKSDEISEDVRNDFLKILLEKMMKFHLAGSESQHSKLQWITREACLPDKLQEGGTFGKTIHLRLKCYLADLMAFVVSIIDENNNLDVLHSADKGMEWKWELWLQIFRAITFPEKSAETVEYSVKTVHHLNMDHSCKFPFSFIINEEFMVTYNEAQKLFPTPDQGANRRKYFDTEVTNNYGVAKSKVLQVWSRLNCTKMMKEYAYDLLKFTFQKGANDPQELNAMTEILYEYSKKIWNLKKEVNGVAVTFHTFQEIIGQLSTISAVFKICPQLMKYVSEWVLKQQDINEFQVHEYAVIDLISWSHEKAKEIGDDKMCVEWMNVSAQIKKTYISLQDAITSENRKAELLKKSRPVAFLDTLLSHLLPWDRKNQDYAKYAALVVDQAKKVFRAMETVGFYNKEVLKIVITVIRRSIEGLQLSLIMNWQKSACVCGKRIQTPVKMPCGAFICTTCAEMIQRESRICPRCANELPKDFSFTPSEVTAAQQKLINKFQASCTGFFLEYLTQYCFSTPVIKEHGEDREKVVALFEGTLLPEGCQTHSKQKFKLETSKIDLNIATKSSIFRLLLSLDEEFIKDKVNEVLVENLKDDTFVMSILKGLENFLRISDQKDQEEQLRESWVALCESRGKAINYDILCHVARIRFALMNLVTLVENRRTSPNENEIPPQLELTVKDMCSRPNSEIIRDFITKTGMARHGTHWLSQMLANEEYKIFISSKVRQHVCQKFTDYWDLFGPDYSAAKVVGQTMDPSEFLKFLQMKFNPSWKPNVSEKRTLQDAIKLDQRVSDIPGLTRQDEHALRQLVLMTVAIVFRELPLMQDLRELVLNPENIAECFWPAMPETICNETMVRCSEYELIDGALSIASSGSQRHEQQANCSTGYLLHSKKTAPDNPADRITEQAASVIQFFIHSCMIVAIGTHTHQILRMIKKDAEEEGYIFLANQLLLNLTRLSHGLGCNLDEAIIVLGTTIVQMARLEISKMTSQSQAASLDWKSKESRKNWEKQFRERYLLPIFKEADSFIVEGKKMIKQENELKLILNECFSLSHSTERLTCNSPLLWKSMKEPAASQLLHQIADSDLPGGVLKTIFQSTNLHLVSYLESFLKLQETLMQKFQTNYDMKDLEKITFEDVRRNEHFNMSKLSKQYIELWNKALPIFLVRYSSDKDLEKYMKKIDVKTPITMALPSARGRGKCAKILAEYLIDLQNEFLEKCVSVDGSIERIEEVGVIELLPSHFVSLKKEHDLLDMIGLHYAYYIHTDENGSQHHRITYNIPALEKEAKERYVTYKKRIKKQSLRCMKYAQDVGVGGDWEEVKTNVTQVPLTAAVMQEIDDMLSRGTLADICEGVRTLTQAISFLATVKVKEGEKEKKLCSYLESDLMLSATHLGMIPRSTKLCHTLALYQQLSCHKAVCFVQQGLDPYRECLRGKQEEITDRNVLAKLKDAFKRTDLNSLRHHLNEMLIKNPDFTSEMSLTSEVFPRSTFIEKKQADSWYALIPAEIRFKHVADLFRLSIDGIDVPEVT